MRAQFKGKAAQGSRSAFLTPTTGLAEIVEAIINHLRVSNVSLHLNTTVTSINHREHDTWNLTLDSGAAVQADSIILATPAFVSGKMLGSLDPELASVLQSIDYTSTATISIAYRQDDLPRELDGYGYVIPRSERRKALACTWTSTKFPHRAPAGYALLRVFVGRAGQEIPWNQDDLLDLAKEELKLTLGITAEPILSRVFMWDKAMPQYNLGHPEKLKQIDSALEKYPSLALAGNGYRGIGIPDCIRSGDLAVNKIRENRGVENSPTPTTH
jgi:oxygen-dependent protoporphyrinogen oxidase